MKFSPPADFKIDKLIPGTIDGVLVYPLKRILDDRGAIYHFLRSDDAHFTAFGEIYFSHIQPGVIKAWHWHSEMELNYQCVSGRIKLVIVDTRLESSTFGKVQEIALGPENHVLVKVPKQVWNGFKTIGIEKAIVANCSSLAHDAAEIFRLDPDDMTKIPYNWAVRNG